MLCWFLLSVDNVDRRRGGGRLCRSLAKGTSSLVDGVVDTGILERANVWEAPSGTTRTLVLGHSTCNGPQKAIFQTGNIHSDSVGAAIGTCWSCNPHAGSEIPVSSDPTIVSPPHDATVTGAPW